MKSVVYGFDTDSIDGVMKVMAKYVLYGRDASIAGAKYVAKKMLEERPLKEIFVVDARIGLKEDYMEAARLNTMESWYAFYDMIKRDGLKIDI